MARYKTVPVEVEAFKFGVESEPDWFTPRVLRGDIKIRNTVTGKLQIIIGKQDAISKGDYIVLTKDKELFAISAERFEKEYKLVKERKKATSTETKKPTKDKATVKATAKSTTNKSTSTVKKSTTKKDSTKTKKTVAKKVATDKTTSKESTAKDKKI